MNSRDLETGDRVRKVGGEYRFEGVIVARFYKRPKGLTRIVRYVVENDDGLLFIFGPKDLELA